MLWEGRGPAVLQYVANGIVVGAIIAVAAIGLTLVYSILRLTNFAHGDFVTLGAYTALFINLGLGWRPAAALPVAFVVGAALAILLELLVWRKMRQMRASMVALIVASIGVALALRNLLVFFYGPSPQNFQQPVQRATPFLGLPVTMTADQQFALVASVVLVLAVHALLRYTTLGKTMRALSDNTDLAWVSGIDVDRVVTWTWIIGGGLAAVGGVLYGMTRPLYPELGWHLLLPLFAAIILGGIGHPYGAIAGGFLIGIVQEVSVYFGVPVEYKIAVGFVAMIVALLLFPRGLFGEASYR
nr:branched-chain amino acid ABC transporter permease [Bacillota bacterium]